MFRKKILIFVLIVIVVFGFSPRKTFASIFNFGGFVISSVPCPCSNSWLLTISPPRGGQFLFFNGMPQFEYHQLPRFAVWTLGLYKPGGQCLVPTSHGCKSVGKPKGIITPTVGTSL